MNSNKQGRCDFPLLHRLLDQAVSAPGQARGWKASPLEARADERGDAEEPAEAVPDRRGRLRAQRGRRRFHRG